ncbi:hypothetical protein V8C44DRAFT_366232 [Trichoderma aethiopicum]
MKRAVGPLDKRRKVTRCEACARRRMKCQGGFPCEYCNRTKEICAPQNASLPHAADFSAKCVEYTPQDQRLAGAARLPPQVQSHNNDLCQFSKNFVDIARDLMPLMQTSPPLRDLAIAIGALDAARRVSVRSERESPQLVAYLPYGRSLQSLQQRLKTPEAAACDDVAWISFLLGLFEVRCRRPSTTPGMQLTASQLISASSGDAWAKHMFYGTSKVLQLAGPDACSSPLQQRLFSAFRVLEANRAILYGDATFLSENKWKLHLTASQKHAEPPDFIMSWLLTEKGFRKSGKEEMFIKEVIEPLLAYRLETPSSAINAAGY